MGMGESETRDIMTENRYQEIRNQLKLLALSISNVDGIDVFELFKEITAELEHHRELARQWAYAQQGLSHPYPQQPQPQWRIQPQLQWDTGTFTGNTSSPNTITGGKK